MSDFEDKTQQPFFNILLSLLLLAVVGLFLVITFPVIGNILPHPDEYQFFLNAWSIMGGKQLQNFLHVALTEYVLTGYLLFMNVFTKTGVNFPQGDPSPVTYYYGRLFGLGLLLLNFLVAALIVQKGERRLRLRTLIFAVLYFGSLGIFERYMRINSDSMSVFVVLNYMLLSFVFHRRRLSPWRFLFLDSVFVFLASFTNLKALYMAVPLLFINTVVPYVWYSRRDDDKSYSLPLSYRFVFHALALVAIGVLLWVFLIPRPITDPKAFWYQLKNATVRGVGFDFEYPTQSYNSWAVYIYDFFMEYLGLTQALAIAATFFLAVFSVGRKAVVSDILSRLKSQLEIKLIKEGNLYRLTELIVFLSLLSYYIGVSRTLVHWSRWGVPLGVFGMMLLSPLIERLIVIIFSRKRIRLSRLLLIFSFLFLFSWSLRFLLFTDLMASGYPKKSGFSLTYSNIDRLIKEKGMTAEQAKTEIAWFTGYTSNVGNISLEKLAESEYRNVRYILWPYWNIGAVYNSNDPVDVTNSNQRAFIRKYSQDISYRFPSLLSYYMHYTKYFAWHYLRLTWNPEIDSLVEQQFAVVHLKDFPKVISLDYEVPFKDLSEAYSPYSLTFNLKNLPDSYVFYPCYSNPGVYEVLTGKEVPVPEGFGGYGRTAGRWCHSLWFRVFLRGHYEVRIEGLPETGQDSQMFYSTQNFKWNPETKTASIDFPETFISVEIGVATKEKNIPDLKFLVSYELTPK